MNVKWQSLQTSHRSPLRIEKSMLIMITQHIQHTFIWIKWANALFSYFESKSRIKKNNVEMRTRCDSFILTVFFREHKSHVFLFISPAIWCWLLSYCVISLLAYHSGCLMRRTSSNLNMRCLWSLSCCFFFAFTNSAETMTRFCHLWWFQYWFVSEFLGISGEETIWDRFCC